VTYEDNPYPSNIIEFSNVNPAVEVLADQGHNEVEIVLLRSENGKLVVDENLKNFFVYDTDNRVLSDENNISYARVTYYAQIRMISTQTGTYLPMSYDSNNGLDVTWYYPEMNSMITNWKVPEINEL